MPYTPPAGSSAGFNFRLVYTPPSGSSAGADFRENPGYQPPHGDQVQLIFRPPEGGGAYVPPAGDQVQLEFAPSILPPADDQFIYPGGISSPGMGTPTILLQRQIITPYGIGPGGFGHPVVHHPGDGRPTNYSLLLTM